MVQLHVSTFLNSMQVKFQETTDFVGVQIMIMKPYCCVIQINVRNKENKI